jgi:hypothetical protein
LQGDDYDFHNVSFINVLHFGASPPCSYIQ